MVLITMIDDATSRLLARFYPAGTVEAHMDLLSRWLRQARSAAGPVHRPAQHLRAAREGPAIGRSRRRNPVWPGVGGVGHRVDSGPLPAGEGARGAVVRHGPGSVGEGTAAGEVPRRANRPTRCWSSCVPDHNRRFAKPAREANGCSSSLGPEPPAGVDPVDPERACGEQRLHGALVQSVLPTAPPVYPGERGGRVVIEERLDGSMAIRFREALPEVRRDHEGR